MTRTATFLLLVSLLPLVSACGGGTTTGGPTAPTETSFLSGTWTGTVTIRREGLPETSGPTTWTFALVPNTGSTTFQTTITTRDPWLSMTTTATTGLLPPTPGSPINTVGSYASPRGCTGTIASEGIAQSQRIDGSFRGVDCDQFPDTAVFSGTVTLTKTR